MELNWTTFVLEILNFLVLVWLLKRFLYRPVQAAIERRRQSIEADLAAAQASNQQAEALQQQRQQQLHAWEQQQQNAKEALQQDIDAERERRMAELAATLEAEKQRLQALDEHQQTEQWRQLEQQALQISGRFASQLLARFASPELELLICQAAIEDLKQLAGSEREKLHQSLNEPQRTVHVSSVFPLPDDLRERLLVGLRSIAGKDELLLEYATDPELLAGLRIAVDSLQVRANLHSELAFFVEAGHGQ